MPNQYTGPTNAVDRFWSKVDKSGECWVWTASLRGGYGAFKLGGKTIGAHCFSYGLHYGSIPPGRIVCHICHNRRCVNPSHLYAGTYQDNFNDMAAIGRFTPLVRYGEDIGTAKLTAAQVKEIRALHRAGWKQESIASHLSISKTTIRDILKGRSWRHVE